MHHYHGRTTESYIPMPVTGSYCMHVALTITCTGRLHLMAILHISAVRRTDRHKKGTCVYAAKTTASSGEAATLFTETYQFTPFMGAHIARPV